MNIDELNWPDDAEFYGSETVDYFAGFYKRKDGVLFRKSKIEDLWAEAESVPHNLIPRPATAWKDGIPPVGVECEYRWLDSWEPCKVIGRHEGFVWLDSGGGPFTVMPISLIKFRPLQPTMREKLIEIMKDEISGTTELTPWDTLADVILEKFDLTEKKK